MPGKPGKGQPDQRGTLTRPHIIDHRLHLFCRFRRVGAVALNNVQILKCRQVGGDVAAGSLLLAGDRDGVAVILDVEEHRQLESSGDGQGRPETVGSDRSFTSQHYRDGIAIGFLLEHRAPVFDRLGPAGGGGVLGADIAGHRQHRGAAPGGQVAHHPDVAAVAVAAGFHQRGGKGIFQVQPQAEQQGTGAVVSADAVVRMGEQAAQDRLGQVVTASGKLVEYLFARHQFAFFEMIHRPGGQHQPGDMLPVKIRMYCVAAHEKPCRQMIEILAIYRQGNQYRSCVGKCQVL